MKDRWDGWVWVIPFFYFLGLAEQESVENPEFTLIDDVVDDHVEGSTELWFDFCNISQPPPYPFKLDQALWKNKIDFCSRRLFVSFVVVQDELFSQSEMPFQGRIETSFVWTLLPGWGRHPLGQPVRRRDIGSWRVCWIPRTTGWLKKLFWKRQFCKIKLENLLTTFEDCQCIPQGCHSDSRKSSKLLHQS